MGSTQRKSTPSKCARKALLSPWRRTGLWYVAPPPIISPTWNKIHNTHVLYGTKSSPKKKSNHRQNYMVVQVTPPGIANLGWRFWIIWACICFSFIPITYLFYPETANRTLEDIDRFFESRPEVVVAWNKSMFPFPFNPFF